jgi:ZIP family zinc transporter
MDLQPILFSIAVFASTFLGGLFAIKFKDKLHYIMAFSAGVLLAVVAFDIFPEIIEEVGVGNIKSIWVMVALVCGFLLFHILEKTILIHHAHEDDYADHKHPQVGIFSSLALTGHSFIDGVSIGLGFQVSSAVGILIAIAVMAHAFTDGINSMTLMLVNKNSTKKSKVFLIIHSVAPVLGVVSTMFFTLSSQFLTLYLGFFAGFLLYIGAADILPEAHSKHSSYKLIGLTVLGVIFIFVVTRLL